MPDQYVVDEIIFHAPSLLMYEFGNIPTRARRDDGLPIDHRQSVEALEIFLEYPIIYHELHKQASLKTLVIANESRSSFQDAAYLWLARSLNCRLLTADMKFVQRLAPDIVRDHIETMQ